MSAPESTEERDKLQQLARQLMDPDAGVRQFAADALKGMGPRAMSEMPAFIRVLNKQFMFNKDKCSRALTLVGPAIVEAMCSLEPGKGTKEFRRQATESIERLRSELS